MEIYNSAVEAERFPDIIQYAERFYLLAFKLMKLLPASYIIEKAEQSGELKKGATVIETSSGTFALGLAMTCAAKGYPLVIVSDPVMDQPLKMRLESLGARVEIVENPAEVGGFQTSRLNRVFELLKEIPNSFWPSQYDNPNNPKSYEGLAKEVFKSTGGVDILVATVGSGGSFCGMAETLKKRNPNLIGVAVDTNGSVLFGQEDKPRLLRGLGNSIIPKNLRHSLVDQVHWVTPEDAFYSSNYLHRKHSIFVGPTSGAAFFVAQYLAKENPQAKIVAILPDEGIRYVNTVFSPQWLKEQQIAFDADPFGKKPRLVSQPQEAGLDWSYCEWKGRRI